MLSFVEYQGLLGVQARVWSHLGNLSRFITEADETDEEPYSSPWYPGFTHQDRPDTISTPWHPDPNSIQGRMKDSLEDSLVRRHTKANMPDHLKSIWDRMANDPPSTYTSLPAGFTSSGVTDPCRHLREPLYNKIGKNNPSGLTKKEARRKFGDEVVANEEQRLRDLKRCVQEKKRAAATGTKDKSLDTFKLASGEINGEIHRQIKKLLELGLVAKENAELLMAHDWARDLEGAARAYAQKYGVISMQAAMWVPIEDLWKMFFNPCNYSGRGAEGCETPDYTETHYTEVAHAYAMLHLQYVTVGMTSAEADSETTKAIERIIDSHNEMEERKQSNRTSTSGDKSNTRVQKNPIHWRDIKSEVFHLLTAIVENANYQETSRYEREMAQFRRLQTGGAGEARQPVPPRRFNRVDERRVTVTSQDEAAVNKIIGPKPSVASDAKPKTLEELLARGGKEIRDVLEFIRYRFRRYSQNISTREEGDVRQQLGRHFRAQAFSQFGNDDTNPFSDTFYDAEADDDSAANIPKMLLRGGNWGGDETPEKIVDVIRRTAIRYTQEIQERKELQKKSPGRKDLKVSPHDESHADFLWALAFISEGMLLYRGKANRGSPIKKGKADDSIKEKGKVKRDSQIQTVVRDLLARLESPEEGPDAGGLEKDAIAGKIPELNISRLPDILGKYKGKGTAIQRIKAAIHLTGLALAKMDGGSWGLRIQRLYTAIARGKRAEEEVIKLAGDSRLAQAYADKLEKASQRVVDDEYDIKRSRYQIGRGYEKGEYEPAPKDTPFSKRTVKPGSLRKMPEDDRWTTFGREMGAKEQNQVILFASLHEIADRMIGNTKDSKPLGKDALPGMTQRIIESLRSEEGSGELHGFYNRGAAATRRPEVIQNRIEEAVTVIVEVLKGAFTWIDEKKGTMSKRKLRELNGINWAKMVMTIEAVVRNEPTPMKVIRQMQRSPRKFIRWAGFRPQARSVPTHKDSVALYPKTMRQAGETLAGGDYERQKLASSLKLSDDEEEAWKDADTADPGKKIDWEARGGKPDDDWWDDSPRPKKKERSLEEFPRSKEMRHDPHLYPWDTDKKDKPKEEPKDDSGERPEESPKQQSLFGDLIDEPKKKKTRKKKGGM